MIICRLFTAHYTLKLLSLPTLAWNLCKRSKFAAAASLVAYFNILILSFLLFVSSDTKQCQPLVCELFNTLRPFAFQFVFFPTYLRLPHPIAQVWRYRCEE